MQKAREYSRWAATKCGVNPLAPHLLYTQFLDDNSEEERNLGIQCGLDLLADCDELWYFGDKITQGMAAEIKMAKALGLEIQHVSDAEISSVNSEGEMSL